MLIETSSTGLHWRDQQLRSRDKRRQKHTGNMAWERSVRFEFTTDAPDKVRVVFAVSQSWCGAVMVFHDEEPVRKLVMARSG